MLGKLLFFVCFLPLRFSLTVQFESSVSRSDLFDFCYLPFQIGFRWAKLSPPFQVRTRSYFIFTQILTSFFSIWLLCNFLFVSLLTILWFWKLLTNERSCLNFRFLYIYIWARSHLLFSIIVCVCYIKLLKMFRTFLGKNCRQKFECCYFSYFFSLYVCACSW